MTWHPKPSLTVETLHWTSSNVDSVPLLSSSRLWTLISKGNAKFTFIREHNFGPLSSSPVLFVFSPGETLLTLSVVQEWLDTRNATAETHVLYTSVRSGSWSTDSSCSPLFVNSPTFLNGFCFTILSRVQLSLLLVHFFLPHLFLPFASLLMCLDTELCEQPASFAMTFCVLPSLCKVSMVVFWTNCQVSSLPHDCVAYRTRLRDHLKAFAGVLS